MKSRMLLLASLSLACIPVPAFAHDIKIAQAKGLLANCEYSSEDQEEVEFHFGFCLGYIKATINVADGLAEKLCLTPQVSNGQLVEPVVSMLKKLPPDMLEEGSHVVIAVALTDAFGCADKTT